MYLLDTNILSELVKTNPNSNFISKLKATPPDALFSATICVMELRYGAIKRGNLGDLWDRIQHQILSRIRILPFSYKEALRAGDLIYHLHSRGQPIGIEDIMIASIALSNDLVVVSASTKHFSRIPGLRTENWLE